jgi:hypothetical protein
VIRSLAWTMLRWRNKSRERMRMRMRRVVKWKWMKRVERMRI